MAKQAIWSDFARRAFMILKGVCCRPSHALPFRAPNNFMKLQLQAGVL